MYRKQPSTLTQASPSLNGQAYSNVGGMMNFPDLSMKPQPFFVQAGASVLLTDSTGQIVTGAVTGPDGVYRFTGLPEGHYTVTARTDRFHERPWSRLVLVPHEHRLHRRCRLRFR